MATIDWNEANPSDSSLVAQAPTYVRNVWKNIAVGLAESLYWPGSGGGSNASQGELKEGTARVYYAAESASSYGHSGLRGKLFLASDTTRLFGYGDYDGSRVTYLMGTPFFVEHADPMPGAVWVQDNGSFQTDTSGGIVTGRVTMNVSYTTSDDWPAVFLSGPTTHSGIVTSVIGNDPVSDQTYFNSNISGSSGTVTYFWTSLGTVKI